MCGPLFSDGEASTAELQDNDLKATVEGVRAEFGTVPASLRAEDKSQVCVFVDPVDGTKEFVEGAPQLLSSSALHPNAADCRFKAPELNSRLFDQVVWEQYRHSLASPFGV